MSSDRSIQTSGIPALASDRATLYMIVVGLAGLALGCLAALAFVAAFPFPTVGPPSSGVLGIVTIQGYPKSRESVYFAVIVLLVVATATTCVGSWLLSGRRIARRLALDQETALRVGALAFLPCFAGLGLGLLARGRVVALFIATLGVVLSANVVLLAWRRPGTRWFGAARRLTGRLSTLASRLSTLASRFSSPEIRAAIATVVLAGGVFGWFLPMAVPLRVAPAFVSRSWFWPLGFVLGWAALARLVQRSGRRIERPASRAALAFLPALFMLAVPFLIDFPRLRAGVLLLSVISVAAAGFVVASRARAVSEAGTEAAIRWSLVAALVLLALAWCWQPDLPGIQVRPGDGDHLIAFLNDGLHGKMVYRDFWYPYGPLTYHLDLISARISGLDRYYIPSFFVTTGLGTLLLCVTARTIFLSWPVRILGSLLLFLAWPPLPVQFRVYAGYFMAVLAAAAAGSGRVWALRVAGVIGAVGFLFSHESGIAALVGCQAGFLWACRQEALRGTLQVYARRLASYLTGLLGVLLPVTALAAWLGALGPYFRSTFGFVAVNDECCGLPFPGLWDGLPYAAPLPSRLQNLQSLLLTSDVFRYFYLPVLLYISVALYVVTRPLRGRPALRQDAGLLGVAGFATLYFRYALGRSDVGHAIFTAIPALVLGSALLERIAFRVVRVLRRKDASHRPAWEWLAELAILTCGFIYLAARLGFADLPDRVRAATRKLAHYHQLRHAPREIHGWQAVQSSTGGRFYWPTPVATMVQATLDHLRAQTQVREGVFAFPYAFRYNVLLDRPNPLNFGSCIWGAAARPSDQQRLIRELAQKRVRYIVYDESEWPDMDGVPTGDRFADLADFVFTNYALERQIGATSVLRLRDTGPLTPPSVVEVARAEHRAFLRRGWYYPYRAGPVMARWTAATATARLTRRASHRTLFVDGHVDVPEGNPARTLSAAVDGREVGRADLSTRAGWTSLRFPLPEPTAEAATVLVRLDTEPLTFPVPMHRRRLGMTVMRLGFE
jgi:hypothetical protein